MRSARLATAAFAVTVLGWLLLVPAARAQRSAGEEVVRQQLIDAAQTAHQKGQHQEALELAQRAAQLRKSPTLLSFIAEEQEEVGALAGAYATAQQCVREGEMDLEAKLREKAIDRCRGVVARLQGRVSYVVVDVPSRPQGLTIALSGQRLNQAAIGFPYVITPGKVTVEASAPGHVPYRLEIDVPEGKTVKVTVGLAPESSAAACPAGQRPDAGGRCTTDSCRVGTIPTADGLGCCWPGQTWEQASKSCLGAPNCPPGMAVQGTGCVDTASEGTRADRLDLKRAAGGPEGDSPPPGARRFSGYAIAAAASGVALLGAGGIVWLVANDRFGDLKTKCDAGCTVADRRREIEDIKTLDNWALGLAIGGAAAVGTGAVLQWLLPRPEGAQVRVAVDPVTRTVLLAGSL
jgi:hypothetical protein